MLPDVALSIKRDSKLKESVFVRKSIKYVIPNDRIDKVVAGLSKYLPISPFLLAPGLSVMSQVNSSTYFDDESLTCLKERMMKNEGAELYRIRWYGENLHDVRDAFVERKRHHDYKKVGKYSNKKRVTMPKEDITRFLLGADVEELLVDKAKLVTDIQNRMMYLKPRIRTKYSRTSFMNPEQDSDLRVTLDQNIMLGLEPREGWRNILANDGNLAVPHVVMPFCIIEVKVAMREGGKPECPAWIAEILEGALAQKIKISKYGYGCKLLIPEHASPTPKYWSELQAFINSSCISTPPQRSLTSFSNGVRKPTTNSVELSQDLSIDIEARDKV